jgi:hypothetical protein
VSFIESPTIWAAVSLKSKWYWAVAARDEVGLSALLKAKAIVKATGSDRRSARGQARQRTGRTTSSADGVGEKEWVGFFLEPMWLTADLTPAPGSVLLVRAGAELA